MNVFISSVIAGFEPFRDATGQAIRSLGDHVIRAEDFGAVSSSPQEVCLRGVREADVVVLLVGARYGYTQASGLSATHEEYREARERCRVLVFVQQGVDLETPQREFLREVQAWSSGHYTVNFSTSEELRDVVTRALHELELSQAAGPVDEGEMLARAQDLLPPSSSGRGANVPTICLAVAGGPRQQVLRPVELEATTLRRAIQQAALFGEVPIFDETKGTQSSVEGHALVISQDDASLRLDELGGICVTLPASDRRDRQDYRSMASLSSLIDEDVQDRLQRALRFAGWLLDHVDPVKRLSDVAVVAALLGAGYMPWRTRAEHQAGPNEGLWDGKTLSATWRSWIGDATGVFALVLGHLLDRTCALPAAR